MIQDVKVLASAVRTTGNFSADLQNNDPAGTGCAQFFIDVTAASGTTPSLVVIIEGFDSTSGKYYTLLQSASITAVGQTILHLGPGLPATANVSANMILPKNYRVRYTITGTTPSFTFSVGASLC